MSPAHSKRTIRDIDLQGRRVFLRVDYNVQLDEHGFVFDDLRLRESLPTIEYLREAGARIVICSHRGRPRGEVVETLRNAPVARHLGSLLGAPVASTEDCIGLEAYAAVEALKPGDVLLLENVRFHPGEEANDPEFAWQLASLADVYVGDAFGTAHRAHASIVGVPEYLPAVAGLLMDREIDYLRRLSDNPEHPFALVLGGAKVADKIGILNHLCGESNVICVGGGVANTFLSTQGIDIADSLWDAEGVPDARHVFEQVEARPDLRLYLPVDAIVGFGAADRDHVRRAPVDHVPSGWRILDIGPATIELFRSALEPMRTVVWNGPLGWFEREPFDHGSLAMAEMLADLDGTVVVGGGETAAVVQRAGVADRINHVSTGGAASLAMLQGKPLPGEAALDDA
ncbi:MAG: phosphoglycerate kinase [Chloroflexi bacterium]|nr:phosphoglycerate kinase [Chloroflexota bacterium]